MSSYLLQVTTLNHCFVFQERNTNKCQLTDLALEDLMNMVLRWCWCWKDQKDQAHSMIRNLCLPVFIADNCRTLVSFMFTKIVKILSISEFTTSILMILMLARVKPEHTHTFRILFRVLCMLYGYWDLVNPPLFIHVNLNTTCLPFGQVMFGFLVTCAM